MNILEYLLYVYLRDPVTNAKYQNPIRDLMLCFTNETGNDGNLERKSSRYRSYLNLKRLYKMHELIYGNRKVLLDACLDSQSQLYSLLRELSPEKWADDRAVRKEFKETYSYFVLRIKMQLALKFIADNKMMEAIAFLKDKSFAEDTMTIAKLEVKLLFDDSIVPKNIPLREYTRKYTLEEIRRTYDLYREVLMVTVSEKEPHLLKTHKSNDTAYRAPFCTSKIGTMSPLNSSSEADLSLLREPLSQGSKRKRMSSGMSPMQDEIPNKKLQRLREAALRDKKNASRIFCETPSRQSSPSTKTSRRSSKTGMRRRRKMWSEDEESRLIKGVQEFGAGRWSHIHKNFDFASFGRTKVDLKDKYRNMLRKEERDRLRSSAKKAALEASKKLHLGPDTHLTPTASPLPVAAPAATLPSVQNQPTS